MEKVDGKRLTPVFSPAILTGADSSPDQTEALIRLLDRYGPLLGEHLVLGCESIEAIETIRRQTNKKPVPLICFRSRAGRRVHLDTVRPPDARYAEYLAFVLQNRASFDYVTVGNEFLELGGLTTPDRNPFHDVRVGLGEVLRDLEDAEARFPELIGRTVFGVMDWNLEREARVYGHSLPHARVRNFLVERNRPTYVWTGFWPLFQNKEQVVAAYPEAHRSGHLGSVPDTYKWKGPFPYDYYGRYLKSGLKAISGIGYRSGAKNHHLRRLIDFGYAGCLFLLPTDRPPAEWSEIMRDYLTDVEGGERA